MRSLLMVLLLAGCSMAPSDPVSLLTANPLAGPGCYAESDTGRLVADPKYGTAIVGDFNAWANGGIAVHQVPVAWRPGFTGQRVGAQVEVLDSQGHVVAVTGQSYSIDGGSIPWQGFPDGVFWACDALRPQ
jgi:hypothetical protein